MFVFCALVCTLAETHLSLARRIDLGIQPSDGIAIVGSLLGVVVAVNIALAAQQTPQTALERVRDADWSSFLRLISTLCASFACTVALMCWTSRERLHSWGGCIGLTLMTITAGALAGAVQTRTRPDEALLLDQQAVKQRHRQLVANNRAFAQAHPSRQFPWVVTILLCLVPGLVTSLISVLVAWPLFELGGYTPHTDDLGLLFLMAVSLAGPLGYTISRCRWFVPAVRSRVEVIPEIWWLMLAIAMVVSIGVALMSAVPPDWRLAIISYLVVVVALPTALVLGDNRRLRPLTSGLRAATGKSLSDRERMAAKELEQIERQRRRTRRQRVSP